MSLLEELLGTGTRPLSEVVSSEIKAQLNEDTSDIRQKLEEKFDEMKACLNDRFDRFETSDMTTSRISREVATALPNVDMMPPSPSYEVDASEEREPEWMYEEEETRDVTRQMSKFNVHWWTKEGDTQQRLHPVAFPVNVVGKMAVATLWAIWHRRGDDALFPPYKLLRVFDVSKPTEKYFYKAKSVCEVIYEHLVRLNALPRDKVLSDCTLEELRIQCERGVRAIVEGHNEWLKKRWEKLNPHTRTPFKPFKPRKLTNIAFTTLHKYLHRRGQVEEEEESVSNDGSV